MPNRNLIILLFLFLSLGLSAQVINAGVGGNSTSNLLSRINQDVLNCHPDLVIVMVGTNDMLNSKKMNSYAQYTSNLQLIVSKIKETNAEIVLMSPPTADSSYLFERHNPQLFQAAPNVKLDSVRNIMARIAQQNKVHFIDNYQLFKDLNLPQHNKDLFIMNPNNSGHRDGIHPTRVGYFLLAENVFHHLKKYKLLSKGDKVICFGDSITRGSKVKGSGTAEGETYPAYLKQKINDYFNRKN